MHYTPKHGSWLNQAELNSAWCPGSASEPDGIPKLQVLQSEIHHYLHDGSVASLKEMFDPDRLSETHVPGGFTPPDKRQRAIKGHEFGLKLARRGASAADRISADSLNRTPERLPELPRMYREAPLRFNLPQLPLTPFSGRRLNGGSFPSLIARRKVVHSLRIGRLSHYRKVLRPGTHFLLITLRHNPADLQDMRKIVRGPCRHELPQRYSTQRGMGTHQFQLGWLQIQISKLHEIVGAPLGKFVQQCRDRFALAIAELRVSIEGLKGLIGAMLQDDHHSRHPIRFLPVNQMTDNHVRTPRARPFGGCGPLFREAAQHSIERRRSPRQYGKTFFEEKGAHESMLVAPNPSGRVHR